MDSADNNKKIKKLAVVGADPIGRAYARTYYFPKLFSQLENSQSYEISFFYNFTSSECYIDNESKLRIYHLQQLPEIFSESNFDLILYIINNSFDSYLYNWFRDSYPGLVLLGDASLFNLELGSLMHATDPIGLDGRFRSYYPNSKVSIGREHVLGRSLEIYSSLFPMLKSIDPEYGALVLENRLARFLADHGVKTTCIPISDFISSTSEFSNRSFNSNNSVLFLSYTPFSFFSRELRTLAGYESYREAPIPAYYIVSYSGDVIVSVDEVSIELLQKDMLKNIGALVLTDIQPAQGVPMLIYKAMELGLNISLPLALKDDFERFSDISYHGRNTSLLDIPNYFSKERNSLVYSLSEEFMKSIISTLEKFSLKISQLNIVKADARRDKLNSSLELFINKWTEASSVIGLDETSLNNLKLNLEELFPYEKA